MFSSLLHASRRCTSVRSFATPTSLMSSSSSWRSSSSSLSSSSSSTSSSSSSLLSSSSTSTSSLLLSSSTSSSSLSSTRTKTLFRLTSGGRRRLLSTSAPSTLPALGDDAAERRQLDALLDNAQLRQLGVRTHVDLLLLREHELLDAGVDVVAARTVTTLAERANDERAHQQRVEMARAKHAALATAPTMPPRHSAVEVMQSFADTGYVRAERDARTIFVSSALAGAYLVVGASMYLQLGAALNELVALAAAGDAATSAALRPLVSIGAGAVFPIGLSLIVLTETDLLTGNMLYCALPLATRPERAREWLRSLAKVWSWSFAGNFAASVVLAGAASSLLFSSPPLAAWAVSVATAKATMSMPMAFASAIGCNWLVCLALFGAKTSNSIVGKLAALWLPIWSFVGLGLQHCVANMFIIPLGMACGAPVTTAEFLFGSLLPVVAGNIVGGALFTGMAMWFVNRKSLH